MHRWSPSRTIAACALLAIVGASCTSGSVDVHTAVVESADVVRTVAAPATVDAVARVDVRAPVTGTVVVLAVEDGGQVEAGEPLFVLASDSVELQLE